METVPDVAVGAVEPSDDAVAPSDKAVKSLGGGSEAASSSADVTSGAASDAATGTSGLVARSRRQLFGGGNYGTSTK